MTTIMISLIAGETPVDEYEESEDGMQCPLPTVDEDVNNENRETAVETANYRDPADSGAFRLTDVCGNCASYNQTDDILECIGSETSEVGYCQSLKFVCSAAHTCDKWVEGGPITSDSQEDYRDIL